MKERVLQSPDAFAIECNGQQLVFTRAEIALIVPHQREHYVESRLNVWRKLVTPRSMPKRFQKASYVVADEAADIPEDFYRARDWLEEERMRRREASFNEHRHNPNYKDPFRGR